MLISSKHFRSFSRKPPAAAARGFTLIELLIVIGIVAILTGFILFQQGRFNSATLLRSLSYSVALSMRQAQVYGTSVFGTTTSPMATPVYAPGYGVSLSSGDNSHYVLFADLTGSYAYATALGQQVKLFSLGKGYTIKRFCGILASGSQTCSPTLAWLSVVFKRPNPDAFVYGSDGGTYVGAYVQLQSTDGTTRSITVSSTGQIAVGGLGT